MPHDLTLTDGTVAFYQGNGRIPSQPSQLLSIFKVGNDYGTIECVGMRTFFDPMLKCPKLQPCACPECLATRPEVCQPCEWKNWLHPDRCRRCEHQRLIGA